MSASDPQWRLEQAERELATLRSSHTATERELAVLRATFDDFTRGSRERWVEEDKKIDGIRRWAVSAVIVFVTMLLAAIGNFLALLTDTY